MDTIGETEKLFMVNENYTMERTRLDIWGTLIQWKENIFKCESNETPSQNAVSNFGCIGNPYTYDFDDGWIMILMEDDEYHIFYEKDMDE